MLVWTVALHLTVTGRLGTGLLIKHPEDIDSRHSKVDSPTPSQNNQLNQFIHVKFTSQQIIKLRFSAMFAPQNAMYARTILLAQALHTITVYSNKQTRRTHSCWQLLANAITVVKTRIQNQLQYYSVNLRRRYQQLFVQCHCWLVSRDICQSQINIIIGSDTGICERGAGPSCSFSLFLSPSLPPPLRSRAP